MTRLMRYALAFAGPASGALAQFLLSLILLHVLSISDFGAFSILLIASQFAQGLWSALFCSPLPVLLSAARSGRHSSSRSINALFGANLIAAFPVALLFLMGARALRFDWAEAALFALFGTVSLWRWFARAHAYAAGRQERVILSDVIYSLCILVGVGLLHFGHGAPLVMASGALATGAIVGLMTFGRRHLGWQFLRWHRLGRCARDYADIWRRLSGWSLLGVLTTETTTNAHSYIVTLIAGPRAFAVIAASALLTRPSTVVLNALNEYERAQMAREIAAGDGSALRRSMRFFRAILGLAWVGTVAVIAVLLLFAPRLLIPPSYNLAPIALGAAMWMAVIAIRVLRAPESAMMQGGGAFRSLAFASVWSAIVSVATVVVLLELFDPIWSILGIFAGEVAFWIGLWPVAQRWLRVNLPEERQPLVAA